MGGFEGGQLKNLEAKKGRILLLPALGGLWDEGKKRRNFGEIFSEISIINISASKPNIEKI